MFNPTSKLAGSVLAAFGMSVLTGWTVTDSVPTNDRALALRAHATLIDVLERDEKFIKVHAAEILNSRGEKERVRPIFERELELNRTVPGYRVGIWRVLAGAARNRQERAEWIARIEAAFMDVTAADRIGAVESLGKLGHRVDGEVRRA